MQRVKVTIRGTAALLMHRYSQDEEDTKEAKRKDRQYDPVEEAKKASYFDDKIGMYIPSTHIEGALKKAAVEFKLKGQKTYKDTVQSCVFVEEEKIPLGTKEWDEIDRRRVKVQSSAVVRARPRFNPGWELTFTFQFNEDRIHVDTLRQILEEAGVTKGISDHRPKFGRFEIVKWEELPQKKKKKVA